MADHRAQATGGNFNEIEMQTYSISYSYPVTYPSTLPFNWESEPQVMLNPCFYPVDVTPDVPPERNVLSESYSDQFELDSKASLPDFDCHLAQQMSEDSCGMAPRSESVCSAETPSTAGANPPSLPPSDKPESLTDQLKFILEESKRSKKVKEETRDAAEHVKGKITRKRKTKKQLEILAKACQETEFPDKDQLESLVALTGLKKAQVYKWCWDNQKKPAHSPKAELC